MKRNVILAMAAILATGTTACTGAPGAGSEQAASQQASVPAPAQEPSIKTEPPVARQAGGAEALPVVIVHKSPTCGCCGLWVDHLRAAGFRVEVRNSDNLMPIKQSVGVPADKASCHTAQVGAYFVEGHVPAEDIKRLLMDKPDARGLTVPGMPAGSPGMEMPDGSKQPYTVELVGNDGTSTNFASH